MFYQILILLLLLSATTLAQTVPVAQAERTEELLNHSSAAQPLAIPEQRTLVREISIEGFVLEDKNQFVNLFKSFRNKHLSSSDINGILDQLKVIYELAGYQNLVSIGYQLKKNHLIFTVTLIS